MLAWTVLWVGGCADESSVREDEQAPEPAGRRELVILTPADSVSAPDDPSGPTDPSDASDASPVFFDPDGQFTIQVGVYRDAKRAEQKVRELKDEGYPAYSVQSDAGVRGADRLFHQPRRRRTLWPHFCQGSRCRVLDRPARP